MSIVPDTTEEHRCQGTGVPPGAMWVSEGHTAAGAMLNMVYCTATWGHGDTQAQTVS